MRRTHFAGAFVALLAMAAPCYSQVVPDSDTVTVAVGGQNNTFNFAENAQLGEGTLLPPPLGQPFFTVNNVNIGNLPLGVDMLEGANGPISDTLIAQQNGANVDLFFRSDPELQVGVPLFPTVVEDGTPQDI